MKNMRLRQIRKKNRYFLKTKIYFGGKIETEEKLENLISNTKTQSWEAFWSLNFKKE